MIYIKDYRAANALDSRGTGCFTQKLDLFIGRIITVTTDGGCAGITGVLVEVYRDSIRLITKLPESRPAGKCGGNRGGAGKSLNCFGTSTVIMLEHIVSVSFNEL